MRPAFLLVLALLFFTTAPAAARPAPQVTVEGTEFVATLADGRILRSRDLVGAILDLRVGGRPMRVRIAAVEPDPDDRSGTVWLHTLETAAADGTWANICDAGPDGRQQAFPLAGGPQGMELSCTGGAIAKCVRFGYRRWASTGEGVSLAPLHAACVRMVRGDYGGIRGWTVNGMRIDLYDDRGVQKPDNSPADAFEAGWSPEGAVCVHHVRVKEKTSPWPSWKRSIRRCAAALARFARRNSPVLMAPSYSTDRHRDGHDRGMRRRRLC